MKENVTRCAWVPAGNERYEQYHDTEWGVPVHDDHVHFEFLILEGAQAGLSWETILKRRADYTKAFANFDWKKVAKFDEDMVEHLLTNTNIIRNRAKVKSAITNARCFEEVRKEFGSFDAYVWQFVEGNPLQPKRKSIKDAPVFFAKAESLSKDLKKRGFSFVGPTIMYAYMQAVGLINDHEAGCFRL